MEIIAQVPLVLDILGGNCEFRRGGLEVGLLGIKQLEFLHQVFSKVQVGLGGFSFDSK